MGRGDKQTANRHMKYKGSTLPNTREMQIKMTLRYYLTYVKRIAIKKTIKTSAGGIWTKRNHLDYWWKPKPVPNLC